MIAVNCSRNPCVHGTCTNSLLGFSCKCDKGYTGNTCNTAIDHCSRNPCVHGTCTNSLLGFSCKCDKGYTGNTCNTAIDLINRK
ncbi:neurogenic locus notch homolog protein 1-like [Mytilus californianus]|uniref:neurogenic locus notch homolog protein 1-like n=1 Tax=Mytilus californianus TaxID=6549 RepID=UPI00224761C4|nr:neurogenic locus notch homolog protein 1-like [Mytilus californianus]